MVAFNFFFLYFLLYLVNSVVYVLIFNKFVRNIYNLFLSYNVTITYILLLKTYLPAQPL